MSVNHMIRILIEITVYSFVLFAAVMLFKRLFRKHISPVLGYAVWALLILRLMIPVTIDSNMKLFVIPEAPIQTVQTQSAAVPNQEVMAETDGRDDSAAPVYNDSADRVSNEVPAAQPDDFQPKNESVIGADTTAHYSKSISWQTALVMLWAAGAAISAGLLMLLFGRIQRKTSRGSNAPENILRLVGACKRDMGIRADIKVLVLDWLDTPALTASIKPKLLLPMSMLQGMNLRQIEFGIRHELMHYRHRDYLTALLLMLLRCVYWFNPVVWFAVKQIETDMEAACDAAVTASLGRRECFDYAQTMIDLSSKANVYMLGMGVSTGRASMEKRVRGIFMDRRTKLSVRLAALVLSGLLIFTCFTTACQPVKAEQVNTSTSADISKETAAAAPEVTAVSEPEVNPNEGYGSFPDWVETYSLPNLTVDINAKIVTPETDVFPVYKVKKRTFDDETMQKVVDYFAKNAVGVRDFSYTEDELKEQLAAEKKYTNDKETINRLKEEIKNVKPETFSPVANDMSLYGWHTYQLANDNTVTSIISHDEEFGDEIYITKNSIHYDTQYERWIKESGPYRLEKPMKKAFENMKLTEQDARAQADALIAELGLDSAGISKTEKAIFANGYTDDILSGGWCVTLSRSDKKSIPIDTSSMQTSGIINLGKEVFVERWFPEWIEIYIDDSGIQSMKWFNSIEVIETTDENAKLLPFENIEQSVKDAIEHGYENMVNQQIVSGDHGVKVSQIVLTNVVVPISDELDYQMLVPAWLVYYKEIPPNRFDDTYVFAVNAIDGTPINFRMRRHVTDEDLAQINAENNK